MKSVAKNSCLVNGWRLMGVLHIHKPAMLYRISYAIPTVLQERKLEHAIRRTWPNHITTCIVLKSRLLFAKSSADSTKVRLDVSESLHLHILCMVNRAKYI